MQLTKLYSFLDCPGDTYGLRCAQICECGSNGRCDNVEGCICNDGWSGVNCDIGKSMFV